MKKTIHLFFLSCLCLIQVGCSTPNDTTVAASTAPMNPASQAKVRQAETIKEYSYNPYVDPTNPDVRFSEGVLHQVEQTPQWDLTPGAHLGKPTTASSDVAVAGRKKIEEGPMEEVANDQVINPNAVPAHLEQELVRERQYRQALSEQLQGQINLTQEFVKQLATVKQLADENRQLNEELKAIKAAEAKRAADEKAKEDAAAAQKALPFYKRWFSFSSPTKPAETNINETSAAVVDTTPAASDITTTTETTSENK